MKFRHQFVSWLILLMTAFAQPNIYAAQATNHADYYLPVIAMAGDGEVLNTENQTRHLHELMGDKPVLLSFIYTTCNDVNGCPFATQVLHKISQRLANTSTLAGKLRLLTVSFNPQFDTPAVMQSYGAGLNPNGLEWQFLTTRSEQKLAEILKNYQQDVQKIYDAQGQFTGTFSHLLRVYLIDADKQIRNIYNTDLLQVDAIINDIQSLLRKTQNPPTLAVSENLMHYQAGDDKQGYQQSDYQTHSVAIQQRTGHAANLIQYASKPPLGLPKLPIPANNPLTPQKIALGRKLFYDRRLSFNNTFSCAMCHIPEQGYSSNEMATPVGVEGRSVRRNAPSLYNVGYADLLFQDGRENQLEQQVWGPLLAQNEMANPSIGYLIDKIKHSEDYQGLFEQAFKQAVNMSNLGLALASYQRTLNAADSAFDRWYFGKQPQAINEQAQRGFALFSGKAGCVQCHLINKNYALFTDQSRHNTGITYLVAPETTQEKQHLQLAPGIFVDVDKTHLKSVTESKPSDMGYYEISQNPSDRGVFKTPSLRNIALTAPYMHDGSRQTLEQVLNFYNQGGAANENLSDKIKPLGLNSTEIKEIISFLNSLTGSNVRELIADGFAAPIGDNR